MEKDRKNKQREWLFIILVCIAILVIAVVGDSLFPNIVFKDRSLNATYARVLDIVFDNTDEIASSTENEYKYQEFQIEITLGSHKGEKYWMRNSLESFDVYNIILSEGDRILVAIDEDSSGSIVNLHIYDRQRDRQLIILLAIFILGVILIGGKQGLKAILTLVFSIVIIVKCLLPMILYGYNPLLVAIGLLFIIICVTLSVIGGFSLKTLCAILGTTGGVIIAGIISLAVGKSVEITGLANDSTQQLVYLLDYPNIDFQGVLFASILIGSMGAIMDVSISIASSMYEIVSLQPNIEKKVLMKSGMNIGRDIMGSMSNTLILAYTGSSCELMLLFMASGTKLREIVNLDLVASEIIRAIGGSIGLTLTIPITVLLSTFIYKSKKRV